ncbi:MAG: PilZ domain-containing protein, partial [Pseudomonadota bacterium]
MALANKKFLPAAEERRRFQRVKVHLLGRYMLPDRREFPCQVINMSPGGLALLAPGIGNVGDRVVAYLDHIGRVEGKITRIIDNGFAMTIGATPR